MAKARRGIGNVGHLSEKEVLGTEVMRWRFGSCALARGQKRSNLRLLAWPYLRSWRLLTVIFASWTCSAELPSKRKTFSCVHPFVARCHQFVMLTVLRRLTTALVGASWLHIANGSFARMQALPCKRCHGN
eukprot:6192111-Pleurochrysis_carterae.AAC.2